MQLSGHLTRSVFDRYNIISTSDLQAAAAQLDAFADREKSGGVGQKWDSGAITGR
jgi:hypothetical protein